MPPASTTRLGDTTGITVHFVDPVDEQIDAIRRGGFRWVRTDLLWGRVEQRHGDYDFSGYDRQYEALARRGLSPYAILDYGNHLYDGGQSPAPGTAAYAAFLRFVQAAANRYAKLVGVWELWNEPNKTWKPRADAKAYASLCRDAAGIIRGSIPAATIAAGATASIPADFLGTCAQLGAFGQVNMISVHPYRDGPPETALSDMEALEADLRHATGRRLPVIAGEWGYSTASKGITPQTQAAYLTRMILSNFGAGRPITIWYDLVQDGDDASSQEQNFGIVRRSNLAPLPAYTAAMALNQLLGEATLVTKSVSADGIWALRLNNRGTPAAAVWASKAVTSRIVKCDQPCIAFDMSGGVMWDVPKRSTQEVTLDPIGGPVYVLGSDVHTVE